MSMSRAPEGDLSQAAAAGDPERGPCSLDPERGPCSLDPERGPCSGDPERGPCSLDPERGPCSLDPERLDLKHAVAPLDEQVSLLHVACLHGRLARVKLLVESGLVEVNASFARGRRPVHVVLSLPNAPAATCLQYLLDHGADVNVRTDSAMTPLHVAAARGLLGCARMLVHAGADVRARDQSGRTPLDMARSCSHRAVARYLKDCVWQADKKRELEMKKQVQVLYRDLVLMSKLDDCREKMRRRALMEKKMEEWTSRKGLPPASISKSPHAVRNPSPEPDLRGSVTLSKAPGGRPQYSTRWESLPRRAPDLPLDTLERGLFPKSFPGRMASPRDFQPCSVLDLPRLGVQCQGRSGASPWTEVALHLPEVLEAGHY